VRLLDRYLLRELLVPLVYTLGGFLLFWVVFEIFGQLSVLQARNLSLEEVTLYYLVRVPELLLTVLPISLLLALLYALTNHARHHELTAMRAAGVGIWRICLPYLILGLVFSGALFVLGEFFVPQSLERSEEILNQYNLEAPEKHNIRQNVYFRNARDHRIWGIGSYNLESSEMLGVNIEWTIDSGIVRRLIARRALYTNEQWMFFDLQQFTYEAGLDLEKATRPTRTNQLIMPEFAETPRDIGVILKFNSLNGISAAKKAHLTLDEIQYLRLHLQLNTKDTAILETQWHARLAQPWTCLVVVLVTVPFGAASGRRNVFVGVAASIFICFAYFIIMRFSLALGTGGYLSPVLAGWLPNLIFGGTGLCLTQLTR